MEKLLLADFPLIVSAMTSLLQEAGMGGIQVHGANTLEAMESMLKKESYKMLMIGLPVKTARHSTALLEILEKYPSMQVIIFSDMETILSEKKLYTSGVSGILGKEAKIEEIVIAIRQVMSGSIYISKATFNKFLSHQSKVNVSLFDSLTIREREVVDMLIDGKKNRQIGEALRLMPSTVSTFKTKIFNKLHVTSLLELERVGREFKYIKEDKNR